MEKIAEANLSKELNEFLTRKQKIDIMLKEQGWVVGDRTKIIDAPFTNFWH